MNYGLYLSAAAMRVQEYRQDVFANNMANVNTTSFKQDFPEVRSRVSPVEELGVASQLYAPVVDDVHGGLAPNCTQTDFSEGPLMQTGRDLDVALNGFAFFSVGTPGGTQYTRDGRFERDASGTLVAATDGSPVLDESGRPICLPAGKVHIDENGTVRVNGAAQGRLSIVTFADSSSLQKVGTNRYVAGGAPLAGGACVVDGTLENSGVDPTRALVDMMTGQRAYEAASQVMQGANNLLSHAANDIARLV